jgi:hypothetical protein
MSPFEKYRETVFSQISKLEHGGASGWLIDWVREREATLFERFPLIQRCLLEEASNLALEYWLEFPQNHWSLELSCSQFPMFLREKAKSRRVPRFLVELADFEWALHWIPIDPASEQVDQKRLPIGSYGLHPVIKVFRFEHRIYQFYWDMMEAEDRPQVIPEKTLAEPEPELLILSRDPKTFKVKINEASLIQAAVVDILSDGPQSENGLVENCQKILLGSSESEIREALEDLLKSHTLQRG